MRKVLGIAAVAGAVAAIGSRALAPGTHARKVAKKGFFRAGQRLRYAAGRLEGVQYKFGGGRPDPNIDDPVLADRVRSQLGTLQRRLDVPHVQVMVHDRIVTLHGDVGTEQDAKLLEAAALEVSGVMGVHSLLHVGLIPGDTRPSEGAGSNPASDVYQQLLAAARGAGTGDEMGRAAVRAVLSTLSDRIPEDNRDHLCGHLPSDVRDLMRPARRRGVVVDIRTPDDFVDAVAATGAVDAAHARDVVESILGALRQLVPEEAGDIQAVLPGSMKDLWASAAPK